MEFEWDEQKNSINIAKHGIDFKDALHVFEDDQYITREDHGSYGEQRFQVIGMAKYDLVFMVYTERDGDTVRIISARLAIKAEKKMYQGGRFF